MVITDGKVHRRSTITTTTTPLNPVERAYATELASLQKRVKSNPHQNYYYHDTSTTGTTPKWTLKRKRSLTKSNLHHHNKRNKNNNSKPEEKEKEESPTAVDLISPTGQTHWSTISLSDLLAAPRRSDIPDFPGKTDRHVYRDKAYKRARAGLLKSQYSPWDYVSNGALPESASEQPNKGQQQQQQQPNKILSPKEKIWWKIQNTAYDRRDANGIMIREGYLTEWYFNSELRGGVWYRQPKMLEPGPEGYVPKAWLYRWVVVARRNKGGECWDVGIGPRDERVEIYYYHDHALVGVDVESGNNTEAATTAVEKGKKITPVLDSTGLSFCRWEKVQEQQQQLRIPPAAATAPPPQPNQIPLHPPNPSNNNNNNKKPPTKRKRKTKLQLVPDSINPHPNTDDKEPPSSSQPPPPKRHQTHQKKPSTPTPTTVKATTSTTPKFHYTKEFSAEIDEAGLSIVRWRRRHHNS